MENTLAYCGLQCDTCPIYLATLEEDVSYRHMLRESIATQCREQYGMELRTEDITDCDGCRADTGRLFSGCSGCEIRNCARRKTIESCAYCADYACELLQKHFSLDPEAKTRLDSLNAGY